MCIEQITLIQTIGLMTVGFFQAVFAGFLLWVTKKQNDIIKNQTCVMESQKGIIERQAEFQELWASIEQIDRQINELIKNYEKMAPALNGTKVGNDMLNTISQLSSQKVVIQEKFGEFLEKYHQITQDKQK